MMQRSREPRDAGTSGASNVRAAERYRLALPTMMWELGGRRESAVSTETVDISKSGMFLSGQFPLRPGSMISFEVKLPAVGEQPGGTLVGQATVIRNDAAGKSRTGIGAIIHQCEVWPASRTSKLLAQRQAATASRRPTSSGDKRAGGERRMTDRRAAGASKRRRAASLATERRRQTRRVLPSRRKGVH
jgi:hypothetical protein